MLTNLLPLKVFIFREYYNATLLLFSPTEWLTSPKTLSYRERNMSNIPSQNCLLCMRKNPRQQVGDRKYCKFLFVKFPLHHFHQDTSPLLQRKHKRLVRKWMTIYISFENSYYCSHIWQFRATHTKVVALARSAFLSSDPRLSYPVMLDRLHGKFHKKRKSKCPPHHTMSSLHRDGTTWLLVTELPLDCTQNCRSNATRPNFMFSHCV